MKKDSNRFEIVSEENINSGIWKLIIFRDKSTGVLYLQTWRGTQLGGFTALLDKDGKPSTDLDNFTL